MERFLALGATGGQNYNENITSCHQHCVITGTWKEEESEESLIKCFQES